MKEIFDNYIENAFDGFHQAEFKIQQFSHNYQRYFPKHRSDSVLDIGIGRGEMLTCFSNSKLNYLGIDISPSTVNYCKSLNLNCELTDNTTQWLKQNPTKYSLITCLDVLEHIPKEEVIDFLTKIKSSLSNEGIFIVQVPNLQSPFGYLHHFNDFTHVNGFVEHSLRQVLITAGFKDLQFFGFEDIYYNTLKSKIRRIARFFFRGTVRVLRAINGNPNPKILDPVMYCIAK